MTTGTGPGCLLALDLSDRAQFPTASAKQEYQFVQRGGLVGDLACEAHLASATGPSHLKRNCHLVRLQFGEGDRLGHGPFREPRPGAGVSGVIPRLLCSSRRVTPNEMDIQPIQKHPPHD